MSATFKKAGEAVDGMRRQKCRACWWGAYMKDNVCVTRDERRPPAPALGAKMNFFLCRLEWRRALGA
jgi:hypothetical protein